MLGSGPWDQVPAHQPFFLLAVGETLRRMDDPDFVIFTDVENSFVRGVPVGMGEKMPRTPSVFARKSKWRSLDDSVFSAQVENYRSTLGLEDVIEAQFEKEKALGMMFDFQECEAPNLFPSGRYRVAAQGALEKADGSWRVLHDATHGVQINNSIKPRDQLAMPGPADAKEMMAKCQEDHGGVHFGLQADVKMAHRRFLHKPTDHGLLCCKARSGSSTVWCNRVGTFGVGCAAYFWGRLAAGLSRLCIRVCKNDYAWQLIFADDLHWVAHGPRKYQIILRCLLLWVVAGTPFSWAKLRGGLQQDWIGFWLDYQKFELGISESRCRWLIVNIQEIQGSGMVLVRRLHELLGRLGYAMGVLQWGRPFLAPMYSWCAAAPGGACLPLPPMVKAVLKWVLRQLQSGFRTISCSRIDIDLGELFRTDAGAVASSVVIGGWESKDGADWKKSRWFAQEFTPVTCPWLFTKGDGKLTIAASELLGSLVAVLLFTAEGSPSRGVVRLKGGTDNKGNSYIVQKLLTTKWPGAAVLMQLSELLMRRGIWLELEWIPREENTEADQLTNLCFDGFDPALRVEVDISETQFLCCMSF